MRVLVIGGSGFIGTRLLDTLVERGHDVTNFDRRVSDRFPERTVVGDVRSGDEVAAAADGHDAVVNLAAEHRDDVTPLSLYTEVNVGGAAALVTAAERTGIQRIVFTSTVALYGLDKNDAAEDSEPDPFNEYGRSKLAAEQVLRTWAEADPARSLTIVRPSVVFGEGNRGNVYNLARQVHARRFLMVGKGDNRKSMSYVGNIVGFLADALDSGPGTTTVNYADKPDLTTQELLAVLNDAMDLPRSGGVRLPLWLGLVGGHVFDAAAKITRRTFPISAIRIRKFVSDTTVNTDRLARTGYTPPVPLDEAIRRTIEAEFPASERKKQ
jgi:nucleoside-diphosphate-sugar epimerase